MKRLKYILILTLLAVTTLVTAQENYVIDSVCVGADRVYRIDNEGDKASTFEWHLNDTLTGIEIPIAPKEGTPFEIINSPGDTTWGSEVNIQWNDRGVYRLLTFHYSAYIDGCDTLEQGLVKVFELPVAFAGPDQQLCITDSYTFTEDTARNYSSFSWESLGDGNFEDSLVFHPTYYFGAADSLTGSVKLVLTAEGLSGNSTCTPATDTVELIFFPEYQDTLRLTVCEDELPYSWEGEIFAIADTKIGRAHV